MLFRSPHYRRFVIQHQVSRGLESNTPAGFAPANLNDGKGVLFVSHAGIVHPSGFLPIVCGVFPQEHLVRIYQDSPILRALREPSRLEGKCNYCEFRHICGGSRARAYAVTGNLLDVYKRQALSRSSLQQLHCAFESDARGPLELRYRYADSSSHRGEKTPKGPLDSRLTHDQDLTPRFCKERFPCDAYVHVLRIRTNHPIDP